MNDDEPTESGWFSVPRRADTIWLPSREDIALECEKIRAGWDEAEHLKRLRSDWRPLSVGEPAPLAMDVG